MDLCRLWDSQDEQEWKSAEELYWEFVRSANLAVEQRMEVLDRDATLRLPVGEFYTFLHDEYFVWKFTARNRLASTRKHLRKYLASENGLDELSKVQARLHGMSPDDIEECLEIAMKIRGLGASGASGLLALLFPTHFGTVDQFAAKALTHVPQLPEHDHVIKMNPHALSVADGVVLIEIMRNKAAALNAQFATIDWTPRRIDKVLWTYGR